MHGADGLVNLQKPMYHYQHLYPLHPKPCCYANSLTPDKLDFTTFRRSAFDNPIWNGIWKYIVYISALIPDRAYRNHSWACFASKLGSNCILLKHGLTAFTDYKWRMKLDIYLVHRTNLFWCEVVHGVLNSSSKFKESLKMLQRKAWYICSFRK